MEKLIKIIADIENLERENMTPILSQLGQDFDGDLIQKDIAESNPDLINVFTVYSLDGKLLGYFRFNFKNENEIIVKSIQISKSANSIFVIRQLLKLAYNFLHYYDYPENLKIVTWVHNINTKSISLQESLGFMFEDSNRDAMKYFTTKKKLKDKLISLGFNRTFTPYTHPGLMPIRVLQYNIIRNIENHKTNRLEELKKMVLDNKILPGIKYKINNEKLKPIHVDPIKKQIVVEEQFLAFLWSFIYSTFVINEEGIQIPTIHNGGVFSGNIDTSRQITKRAFQLFNWCVKLPVGFNFWPLHLPNPEILHSAEEQFYCEKVNGIFQDTVTYLINHEIAHLLNNHWEVLEEIKLKDNKDRTLDEKLFYQQVEGEADVYARETMVDLSVSDDEKLLKGISIIYANLASFFLLDHPKNLEDQLHPDLDIRLSNTLDYLCFQDAKNRDYSFMLGFMVLHYFFHHHKEKLEMVELKFTFPVEFNNGEDCFNHALNFVNTLKERYLELRN